MPPSRPLRVLMVTRFDPRAPRPQPIQVLGAAHGLASAGARVTLLMDADARRGPTRSAVEAHMGYGLSPDLTLAFAAGTHPGVRGLRRRWAMVRALADGVDAVLTRDFRVAGQLGRLPPGGPPLVHEWHALPSALGQKDEGEQTAARGADAHLFVSQGLRRRVETDMGISGPGLVLPNGCVLDPARAREALAALPRARRVMSASLLRGPADGSVLARAAGDLPPALDLESLGPGSGPGVRSPARIAAGLPGCLCQLALYVDDLNTREFACPLKVVQALGSGVPLVATDLPSVRGIVEHGATALLVPPGDAPALAEAVTRLDRDRTLATRLATRSLERSPAWSWERRGATLRTFLETL